MRAKQRLLPVLASIALGCSGCRYANPAFGELEPTGVREDSQVEESTLPTDVGSLTTRQDTTSRDSAPTSGETDSSRDNSRQTSSSTSKSSSEQSTSDSLTSSSSDEISSRSSSSSASSSTSTSSGGEQERAWPVERDDPAGLQHEDHCKRGAVLCYDFDDPAKTSFLPAQAGRSQYSIKKGKLSAASDGRRAFSPFSSGGVRTEGLGALVPQVDYPLFAGQDFGISAEVFLDIFGTWPKMIAEVKGRLRIFLNSNRMVVCEFLSSDGEVIKRVQATHRGLQPDWISVACFIHNRHLFLWNRGSFDISDEKSELEITKTIRAPLSLFHGAKGASDAAATGEIFMLRVWNSGLFLRDSIVAESANQGLALPAASFNGHSAFRP